jgi:hypothetical protein
VLVGKGDGTFEDAQSFGHRHRAVGHRRRRPQQRSVLPDLVTANLDAADVSVLVNTGTPPTPSCVGDCNGDGEVTINELITGVNIALGATPVSQLPGDRCERRRRGHHQRADLRRKQRSQRLSRSITVGRRAFDNITQSEVPVRNLLKAQKALCHKSGEQTAVRVASPQRGDSGIMVRGFAVVATIGACALVATAASAQCPTPGTVSAVCSPEASCARIAVGNASGSSATPGAVSITFNQGPDDSQAQRGHDDVAAIAFTVGIPGTGDTVPLVFDCVDGNLAQNAVVPGAAIADTFTVVVENAQCTGRNRCLCPDTTAGQERDNFVNIAIYGPKTLPEQGPVAIPKLPASGEIVKLNLKAAAGATGPPDTARLLGSRHSEAAVCCQPVDRRPVRLRRQRRRRQEHGAVRQRHVHHW